MQNPSAYVNQVLYLALGKSYPLSVSLLGPTRARVYFDEAVHPKDNVITMLTQARLKVVEGAEKGLKDVNHLAHAYIHKGYFKLLRRAILPQDIQIANLVLNRVEKILNNSTNKEIRFRVRKAVEWDRKELIDPTQIPHQDNLMMEEEL